MVEVNGKTFYLPKNHEIFIDWEEGSSITVSAWGYYSSTSYASELNNNDNYVVSTALPVWFMTAMLSLLCLSIVLGLCDLIPNIVGSSLLLIYVFVIGYYSTVKRKSFFKLSYTSMNSVSQTNEKTE